MHQQRPGLAGLQRQLRVLRQLLDVYQRELVAVRAGELAAVGRGGVGAESHPRRPAVFKEEQQRAAVIPGQAQEHHVLPTIHTQFGGQIVAQQRRLRLAELAGPGLVDLLLVGKEHQLRVVGGLEVLPRAVALLVLLLAGHPQRLGRDLLEIPLAAEEQVDGIVLRRVLLHVLLHLVAVYHAGAAWYGVLLLHVLQLADDDLAYPGGLGQRVLQILDLVGQGRRLLHPLEDVLLVDVPQLDLCHVLRLHLVDAEPDHQVGDNVGLLLRLPDDPDGLVDVQQDALQTLQKVQLLLLLVQHEVHPPLHAVGAPRRPLLQHLAHAHDTGHPGDEDVEVAAHRVLQRRQAEQLGHQLFRLNAPLQVDGQLQTAQVRLVPHIGDLLDLPGLHQLRHLVQNGLDGGGIGDLIDLDHVLALVIAPPRPHLHAAPARAVDGPQVVAAAHDLATGREIRRDEGSRNVVLRVLQIRDGGLAHLAQVEPADLGRHAHGDALVGGHQHVGERGGQQRRLLRGVVVVVHKVHRVAVQIPEQLGADGGQLGLGVPAGGVGHVPGIHLAEVALAVHEGVQQRLVALGQPHHRLIDGLVAVGVQPHGLAHDVGALRPPAGEQSHLIHGIQQLPV